MEVGFLHFLSQPGAVLSGPGGVGAGEDDVFEAGVDAKLEGVAGEVFFEASWDMEVLGLQHKTWVRAMPQNGGALGVPGKNSLAISQEETPWVQVPADGEDTVGGGELRRGELEGVRIQAPIGREAEKAQM
jgi:hypothetical protein